jgi:putative ubiquitin-RnfH superfamily antitoxin RatB of RatAB toxin-antitoxin module
MAEALRLRVAVLFSPAPRKVREWAVVLDPGCTVSHALQASGLTAEFPGFDLRHVTVGVWGRKVRLAQPLRDGDRIEVYRALTVDPKAARRERFRKQGARAAGLFAKKRDGAKPGY